MKTTIPILLALAGAAAAQTAAVTKNPVNNMMNGSLVVPPGQTLRVDGTLQTAQSPVLLGRWEPDVWTGVEAFTSILSSDTNRHGLVVRTLNSAGAAIVGVSETGAPGGKFAQFGNYSSPAVWIGRDPNTWPWGDPPLSPTLMVTSPAIDTVTPVAVFKRNQNDTVFSIGSDGSVTAPLQTYTDANALVTRGYADANYGGAPDLSGTGLDSTVAGAGAVASGPQTSAFGKSASAPHDRDTAIGAYAVAASVGGDYGATAVGAYAEASDFSVAIGMQSEANDEYAIAIGAWTAARRADTIIGYGSSSATGGSYNTVLGNGCGVGNMPGGAATTNNVAIGYNTYTGTALTSGVSYSIGIGTSAYVKNSYVIQLGTVSNGSEAPQNTFQVWDHQMLNKTTGKIPVDRLRVSVPASATATGTTGQIAWDASYIYICTGTNQWKRVAVSTW